MSPQDQRMSALQKANRFRTATRILKGEIKDGKVTLADTILDPPEHIMGVRAVKCLTWARGIGNEKARRIARNAGISPTIRFKDMPLPTRLRLATEIRLVEERLASRRGTQGLPCNDRNRVKTAVAA